MVQQPRTARQRATPLHFHAARELRQRCSIGQSLHLRPILALVCVAWMEQAGVERRLIGEQQQAFGIRVQPPDGINAGRKTKLGEGAVRRAVRSELRQHTVGFMKGKKHGPLSRRDEAMGDGEAQLFCQRARPMNAAKILLQTPATFLHFPPAGCIVEFRLGESSVELGFRDDLKPDGRERS